MLSVRPLVRPHPDVEKLAKAWAQTLIAEAREQVRHGAIVRKAKPLQATVRLELLAGIKPAFVDWRIPAARP